MDYVTPIAQQAVIDTLERIRQRIDANITDTGTRASGRTQESMHVVTTMTGAMLVGRQYFQSVETGRPAGGVPANFRDIIKQWILDKGIAVQILRYKTNRKHKYTEEERSLNAAAGAIAYTIAAFGSSLFRRGGRQDIYTNVINEEVAQMRQDVAASVAKSLSKSLSAAYGERATGEATYQYLND